MSVKVRPNELSKAILTELNNYTENVSEKANDAVEDVAKESEKKLRAVRSVGESGTWNRYPRTWTTKMHKRKKQRTEATVWNSRHYRLTHLLEHGHVVRNGTGRNNGRKETRKFPHIGPINDEAQKKLEEAIMEAIEKG